MHENRLLMKFVDFFDDKYGFALRQEAANAAQHVKIADSNAPSRATEEVLQEPLLTGRSGAVSAQHSRFQELREKRKASVDRTEDDFDQTLAEEKRKYEQIMQKLDGFKRGGDAISVTEEEEGKTDRAGRNMGLADVALQRRVSASQKGRDGERPISGRYGGEKAGSGMGYASQKECPTMSQFNDDEDFHIVLPDDKTRQRVRICAAHLQVVVNELVRRTREATGHACKVVFAPGVRHFAYDSPVVSCYREEGGGAEERRRLQILMCLRRFPMVLVGRLCRAASMLLLRSLRLLARRFSAPALRRSARRKRRPS